MFEKLTWSSVWGGVIRHVLTFGGGILVAKGWLTEADLTSIVGAVGTLGGFAWSFAQKKTEV